MTSCFILASWTMHQKMRKQMGSTHSKEKSFSGFTIEHLKSLFPCYPIFILQMIFGQFRTLVTTKTRFSMLTFLWICRFICSIHIFNCLLDVSALLFKKLANWARQNQTLLILLPPQSIPFFSQASLCQ